MSVYLRRKRRRAVTIMVIGAVAALAVLIPSNPLLVWNATASAPLGLYRLEAPVELHRGDLALVKLPSSIGKFAAQRGYLPVTVPLIKPVAALAGEIVCGIGSFIFIGGNVAARRLDRDTQGRVMPRWEGCRSLGPDDAFLLNPSVQASFDGRYFGVVSRRAILGRLIPIWLLHRS
ncbi:MAG: S26 family signal peptidase [Pseudomonadota bacterium]